MKWFIRGVYFLVVGVWFSAFLHSRSFGEMLYLAVFITGYTWFSLKVEEMWTRDPSE